MYILTIRHLLAAALIVPSILSAAQHVSTTGSCGNGVTCQGSRWGNCCSAAGFCGSGPTYCGGGCQSSWGTCSSGLGNVSPSDDGSCGPTSPHKYTCQGSSLGNCCSASGFCGRTDTYCGTGCQSGYGTCGGGSSDGGGGGTENSDPPAPVATVHSQAPAPAGSSAPKASSATAHASSGSTGTSSAHSSTHSSASSANSSKASTTVLVSSAAANTSAAASTTASSTQVAGTASAAETPPPAAPASTGLSMGAKAGIGGGVGVAVLLAAGAAALLLIRRRKNQKRWSDPPPPLNPPMDPMEKDGRPHAAELPMWMAFEKDGRSHAKAELPSPLEGNVRPWQGKVIATELHGSGSASSNASHHDAPVELPGYFRNSGNLTQRDGR